MIPLLKKDFWMNFSYLLMTLAFIPIAYVLNLSSGFLYYGLVLGLIFNAFYYDNVSGINQYMVSLPIARQKVVTARYVFCLLFALTVFGYQFVLDRLAHAGLPYFAYEPMTEYTLLTRLCGVIILMAFSLPLYFAFSYMKAFMTQLISFAVFIGLVGLIGKFIDKLNVVWLIEFVSSILEVLFSYPFMIIVLFTVVISLLSLAISRKIFHRKDLMW